MDAIKKPVVLSASTPTFAPPSGKDEGDLPPLPSNWRQRADVVKLSVEELTFLTGEPISKLVWRR